MTSSPPLHLMEHTARTRTRPPWPVLLLFLHYGSFTPSPIQAWTQIPRERRTFPTSTRTTGEPSSCRSRARSLCGGRSGPPCSTVSLAVSSFLDHEESSTMVTKNRASSSPLSISMDDLSSILGGKGRAQSCWDCFRLGVDPLWLYNTDGDNNNNNPSKNDNTEPHVQSLTDASTINTANTIGWTREQIHRVMAATPGHRPNQMLGRNAQDKLQEYFGTGGRRNNNNPDDHETDQYYSSSSPLFSIETHVAQLSKISVASDGTTKLLLNLVQDGLEVETVIIPWRKSTTTSSTGVDPTTTAAGTATTTTTPRRRSTSTLCVSSQVGCAQACRFCMTGRMGKLRSLTADEILSQVYWANKACRLIPSLQSHPIENVVFMGMVRLVSSTSCSNFGRLGALGNLVFSQLALSLLLSKIVARPYIGRTRRQCRRCGASSSGHDQSHRWLSIGTSTCHNLHRGTYSRILCRTPSRRITVVTRHPTSIIVRIVRRIGLERPFQ
jgi:hypothetical protein